MSNVDITHGGSTVTVEYVNGGKGVLLFTFPEEADRWAKYYAAQLGMPDVKQVTVETTTVYTESEVSE